MSISPKLLNEGEHVVVSCRTHVKALFGPILVMLLVLIGGIVLTVLEIGNDTVDSTINYAAWLLMLVVVVWWIVRPFLKWWTTTYTFTNRRLMFRSGFIAKEGRTIPLNRISGVDFEIDVLDRIFGCGTLVVTDASEAGRVELHDIPKVEQVQKVVSEELHRQATGGRADDGT
ncbi:PH domain-containing protein [Nocardioides alcanivorans]|uniref:PH domain-containing protein n=1 Tax=Nocardioides alcanivorans TaxID=2897352 RepID=UPI001F475050|nr:PH domain-containing protein [Nocardioides alcanivorans]